MRLEPKFRYPKTTPNKVIKKIGTSLIEILYSNINVKHEICLCEIPNGILLGANYGLSLEAHRKMNFYLSKFEKAFDKKLNKIKPEASESDPLGKFAFADQRDDVPSEENTPVEDKLLNQITHTVTGCGFHEDSITVDNSPVELVNNLIYKNLYNKVFKRFEKDVYRGIMVTKDWIKNYTGIEDPADEGTTLGDFVYESPSKAQKHNY